MDDRDAAELKFLAGEEKGSKEKKTKCHHGVCRKEFFLPNARKKGVWIEEKEIPQKGKRKIRPKGGRGE